MHDEVLHRVIVGLWAASLILFAVAFFFLPTLILNPAVNAAAFILSGACFLGGLVLGIWRISRSDARQPMRPIRQVYVASVMIMDQKGQHLSDPTVHDPTTLRIEVRLVQPGGRKTVVRAPYGILHQLGEGFIGTAYVQGSWLCGFERDLGGISRGPLSGAP